MSNKHNESQQTIEAVRRDADILTVIGKHVELRPSGKSHVGLCPFHNETTPSFHVNAERGFFYCFGCQAAGNVISFTEKISGLTFASAVRKLATELCREE